MHIRSTLRILGSLLMMFSFSMLPPVLFSLHFDDGALVVFIESFALVFCCGFLLWVLFHRYVAELSIKDGFLITVMFYLALGISGAYPFLPSEGISLNLADALFESFSGLTTTGATVLTGLDQLPRSILYYRQQLQWLGGMGIIVLAVAILPMLGVGGMQLYRAEAPGPVKDAKLTPRIKQTATALWWIYVGLTGLCALAYWAAGMSWFDALGHSFSTVAIGGFSTHDASIGYYNNAAIELVAVFFMIISAFNFGLHYFAWKERSIKHYLRDSEIQFFLSLLAFTIVVTFFMLSLVTHSLDVHSAARYSLFEVTSIFTTTGFAATGFSHWPSMLPFLLFFGAFVGGCAGSTAGGLKVVRVMLLCKQGIREIHRLIHPNAIFPIKQNQATVSDRVIDAVWGFFSMYVLVFLFVLMALLVGGLDFLTAFSAVGACLNNLGPGLGDVARSYGGLDAGAKMLLCLAMVLGRLEIFTMLVLLTPMFWRK